MASVSTAGLAAGMDIHPPGKLTTRADPGFSTDSAGLSDGATAELSVEGRRQSAVSAFADAAQKLMDPATWMATQAISSQPDVVNAISSSNTPTGDYTIEVKGLAKAQATSTATFSGLGTTIGLGTLNLDIGTWNGSQSAFMTNPNWPKASLTIGPKDNSLERVRDRINASGVGVLASVISDATGSRLVLRASGTGRAQAFKVEATPEAEQASRTASSVDATLQELGFDPSRSNQGMQQIEAAADAQATVNGRSLSSPDNALFDPQTELTLQLQSTSEQAVTVSVRPDVAAITKAITGFAQRFNELNPQTLDQNQSQSPDTALISRMQQVLTSAADGPLREGLQAIGIRLNRGSMQVDTPRLQEALTQDPDTARSLLTQATTAGEPGLAQDFNSRNGPPKANASTIIADEPAKQQPSPMARRRLLAQYLTPDSDTVTAASNAMSRLSTPERINSRSFETALNNA
jgi:flagellar hook-associated protein 2